MTSSPNTIVHQSREDNLLAAKQSVREHSNYRLHRRVDMGEDVIDILDGTNVIERHICHCKEHYGPAPERKPFRVEDTAIYL